MLASIIYNHGKFCDDFKSTLKLGAYHIVTLVIVMRSNVRRLVIMDQDTKVRKRLKLEQWKTIITECRASGMTVTSWCKTHGIAEQTY